MRSDLRLACAMLACTHGGLIDGVPGGMYIYVCWHCESNMDDWFAFVELQLAV